MSLNLVRALLILNAKKGWTDEARKKAALIRKAKKIAGKSGESEVVVKTGRMGSEKITKLANSLGAKGHGVLPVLTKGKTTALKVTKTGDSQYKGSLKNDISKAKTARRGIAKRKGPKTPKTFHEARQAFSDFGEAGLSDIYTPRQINKIKKLASQGE